jgi:hypothetical protein
MPFDIWLGTRSSTAVPFADFAPAVNVNTPTAEHDPWLSHQATSFAPRSSRSERQSRMTMRASWRSFEME